MTRSKREAGEASDAAAASDEAAPKKPRRRKRKKAIGEAASRSASSAPRADVAPPAPRAGTPLAALAAAFVASMFLYVTDALGGELRGYTLVATGITAFLAAAASGPHVRRAVGGAGCLAALGLAVVATSPSDLGPALCVAGGLGLAGGIHRLGRLGPDEGGGAVDAAPARDKPSPAT